MKSTPLAKFLIISFIIFILYKLYIYNKQQQEERQRWEEEQEIKKQDEKKQQHEENQRYLLLTSTLYMIDIILFSILLYRYFVKRIRPSLFLVISYTIIFRFFELYIYNKQKGKQPDTKEQIYLWLIYIPYIIFITSLYYRSSPRTPPQGPPAY